MALALCLCAISAAVSGTVLFRGVRAGSLVVPGPYATIDSFLHVLSIPHPGQSVEESLRRFAPGQRLLFVGPAAEASTLRVYYSIAYLAYPRPVSAVFCRRTSGGATILNPTRDGDASAAIGGLIVYHLESRQGAGQLGPVLSLTAAGGTSPWQSYCPSPR